MQIKKVILVFCCLVLQTVGATVFAQPTIRGTVTDSSGEPLVGVGIAVKGTQTGTFTDENGRFVIAATTSDVLSYSYLGYLTVEARPTGPNIHIVMEPDANVLEEVQVVAYGTQKKVTVTGSVASVKADEILKSPTANVQGALTGRIPGLTVVQSSGEPGRDDATFYLRGIGTTNGSTPLILVDGVPRESIRAIDANEIESVSVLKDASATAVFGVRGANGVILITTRRGEKGSMNISASAEYSAQMFARQHQYLSSYNYALLHNEARINDGGVPEFSDEALALYQSWLTGDFMTEEEKYFYPNTDWNKVLYRAYAPQVRANLNVSGGSEKTQYFVSAAFLHQGGMFNVEPYSYLGYNAQSQLDRYNFRSNLDHQLSSRLKLSLDISSYVERVNGTNAALDTYVFPGSFTLRPTQPGILTVSDYRLYYQDEFYEVPVGGIVVDPSAIDANSVYGGINRMGYKLETRLGLNVIGQLNYDLGFITPGLSTKGLISFESRSTSNINAPRNHVSFTTDIVNGEHVYRYYDTQKVEEGVINLSKSTMSNYFLNMQWHINYARTFGKHDVTGLILAQRDFREVDEWSGYTDKYLPFNVLGVSARATYAYDQKYLAEVNLGYNGSEQFSPKQRFGFFPAFSAGWVASNEDFLKDNNVLTFLKLRASYGEVGNDQIGAMRFLYMTNTATQDVSDSNYWAIEELMRTIPSLGRAGYTKIAYNYVGNPDVTWERAKKVNAGLDLSLFRSFTVNFDYFTENRDHVLISRQTVPTLQGISQGALPKVNMGTVKNHGFEVVVGYSKVFSKDFSLRVNANYSYNRNTVTGYDEIPLDEDYTYQYRTTGFSIGQCWGYKIDYSTDIAHGKWGNGYFNSEDDIEASGLTYDFGTPKPGDFIYEDTNNDGIINDKDLQPIGYSNLMPRQNYGASLSLNWCNFDMSILFQGVGQVSNANFMGWGVYEETGRMGAFFAEHQTRWTADRFEAGEPVTGPRLTLLGSTSHVANDHYIMDGSYLRLKNVELGYTLPSKWSKAIRAQSVRFYVNGNNLFTWDRLNTKLFDPEQRGAGVYPIMRNFNAGVNVTF